ncbi:MAG: hypothetical protein AAB839_01470 [Patescibacteria group bacterium]
MEGERVMLTKRKLFAGKTAWVLGAFAVAVLIGTIVQMKMTWNRERMRGISSEANDVIGAAKAGFDTLAPKENVIDPIGEILSPLPEEN